MSDEHDVNGLKVILRGESILGAARLTDEGEAALKGAGFDVAEAVAEEDGSITMEGDNCSVEHPRPCELTVFAGRVQQLAGEDGIDTSELDALFEGRSFGSEGEMESAIRDIGTRTIQNMPEGQNREEAETWFAVAFPEGGE